MSSTGSIREILHAEVEAATRTQKQASEAFSAILKDIPSGLPHPDGALRIEAAKRTCSVAIDNYVRALREYNNYLLTGTLPERFRAKKGDEAAEE